ncbi:MAG: ABC transporter ATP-binding protein [Myxococcota bacterium]|nr:ABC transporter ATP-binding protein [Myxococcota bacterium]
MRPSDRDLAPWVFGLMRPQMGALLLAVLLAGLISSCRGALVFLVREVLDQLLRAGDARAIWLLPAAVVVLFAVQGLARAGRGWLTRRAALTTEEQLRARIFRRLLLTRPERLQARGVGDSLSRLIQDAGKIRRAVGAAVTIVQRPLTALAVAGAALVLAPKLALWAALGLPVVAGVIAWTGRRTREASREQALRLGVVVQNARDGLDGLRTIQAHGAEELTARRFEQANRDEIDAGLRTSLFRLTGPPAVEFSAALGIAAVIGLGALQVRSGDLTAGGLIAFVVALGLLSEPLKGISVAHGLWEEARGGLERVLELLAAPIETQGQADEVAFEGEAVQLEMQKIQLQRGERSVLEDLDLRVHPGELVVIQGESGAGKSSLLDLVVGFIPAQSGRVLWNGTEAKKLSLSSRRAHLALVDQDPWLGAGTIADAIRLGKAGARDREVEQAALDAGLSLPLDLEVGDGGRGVSGGERQRIALARALLRGTPLLLLDEPTSSLDRAAEEAFLDTLRSLRAGRTILLVTHRPGPLRIASRVLVLEGGQLTESPRSLAEVG